MTPRERLIELAREDARVKARRPEVARNPWRRDTPMHPVWDRTYSAERLAATRERLVEGGGDS